MTQAGSDSHTGPVTARFDFTVDCHYGPSGSEWAGTRSVGRSPVKTMLLISSSHEKQTAITEGFSIQRVFIP